MSRCEQRLESNSESEKKRQKLQDSDIEEPEKLKDDSDESIEEEEVDPKGGGREKEIDSEDGYSDPEMERKVIRQYNQQVVASDGFDVGDFSQLKLCGMIKPIQEEFEASHQLQELSEIAIHEFNKENLTNYQFMRVLKANVAGCTGLHYYITFEGKDAEDKAKTFQALVIWGIPHKDGTPDIEVDFCRFKLPTNQRERVFRMCWKDLLS